MIKLIFRGYWSNDTRWKWTVCTVGRPDNALHGRGENYIYKYLAASRALGVYTVHCTHTEQVGHHWMNGPVHGVLLLYYYIIWWPHEYS